MRARLNSTLRLLGVSGMLCAAALLGQSAFAQSTIINSKHDLSSGSSATIKGGTTETCVFCHTPHGASTSAQLWNRSIASGTFTVYSNPGGTIDGERLNTIGTGTGLCLSCHDGVTALDTLINAPGSGWGVGSGTAVSQNWTMNGVDAGNVMPANSVARLGTDLANDHPIAIPYCGGPGSGVMCKDDDFVKTTLYDQSGALKAVLTGGTAGDVWYIDTGTAGRQKTDLPLYVRTFTAGALPSVECATCHEPHGAGGTATMFLRKSNAQSALCTACHAK